RSSVHSSARSAIPVPIPYYRASAPTAAASWCGGRHGPPPSWRRTRRRRRGSIGREIASSGCPGFQHLKKVSQNRPGELKCLFLNLSSRCRYLPDITVLIWRVPLSDTVSRHGACLSYGETMLSILVCHSYFLRLDQKQIARAKPYPPLATLQLVSLLREAGHRVFFFDSMLADGIDEFDRLLKSNAPQVVVFYEDNFNFLSKMCLAI